MSAGSVVTDAPGRSLDRIILALPLLLAVLLVILDGAASLRIPLRNVTPWLYPPTFLLIVVILLAAVRTRARIGPSIGIVALLVLAIYLSMAAFLGSWLPDPLHAVCMGFDDWCYQALGDYLLNNPRGRVAGMSMVDEFGAHLQDGRFSSSGFLAFLGGKMLFKDAAMSHFMLGVICLGVHFLSMLYLGRALFRSLFVACAGAFLATAGGWISEVLELGNYDNLVFIALMPALIGVLVRLEQGPRVSWGLTAAGGVLLAALIETFPEGVPLLCVLLVPLTVFLLLRGVRRPALLGTYTAVILLGLALASPYLPLFRSFLAHQIQWALDASKGAPRNFPGLVDQRRFPAFFALGEEAVGASFHFWNNVLPLVLTALLAAGVWAVRKTHPWFLWTAAAFGSLLVWQNVVAHYDYGTYKVLVCAGWWIYLGVAAGLAAGIRWLRLPAWSMGWWLALLCCAIGWDKYEHRAARNPVQTDLIGPLRELTYVRYVTQREPLLLDLEDFNYTWATYYLRHLPITTFKQRGTLSMPHLVPFFAQGSAPAPETARFVLVEGRRPDALWSNDRFSLLPFTGAYIRSVSGPIAGEGGPGVLNYVWVGTQPETFQVRSIITGEFELRVSYMEFGPRASRQDGTTFEITDSTGPHTFEWDPGDPQSFPIHLDAGENPLSIRCLEPSLPAPVDGDQREGMLQLRGYSIVPRP